MATWVPVVDLVRVMGDGPATTLLREYGGLSISIPKKTNSGIIIACGDAQAAERLCAEYGGMDILLPSAMKQAPTKKSRIIAMLETGSSQRECAKAVGCTERHVQNVAHDIGEKVKSEALSIGGKAHSLRQLKLPIGFIF